MNNIPEIRFSEFKNNGDWKEKNVDDFFYVGSSKRVLQKDWTNQGVPFYRTRELVSLSKNEPFRSEIYISHELFLEISNKYGLPKEGDFLVSGVGTLGISYQVKSGDKFYFKDGNVIWFKLKKELYSNYFKFCFESDHIQNQIVAQASISTVGTYTIQNAKKTKFWYPPTVKEQKKIADCLSSLDEVITGYEKKLKAVQNHKKGLMQNLFPHEGKAVPNYRFPEFKNNGNWEEKNFGSIATFIKGKGISKADIVATGKTPCIRYGELYTTYKETIDEVVSFTNLPIKDLLFSKENDVIMPASGETQLDIATASCVLNGGIALGGDLNIIRSKNNGVFLSYYLNNAKKYEIARMAQGNAVVHLYSHQLKTLNLQLPKPKEQQKIANCLSSVDGLIVDISNKIVELKLYKKGLMQGLFPKVEE